MGPQPVMDFLRSHFLILDAPNVQRALATPQGPPIFTILLETMNIFCNIILPSNLVGSPENIKLWGKHCDYFYYF